MITLTATAHRIAEQAYTRAQSFLYKATSPAKSRILKTKLEDLTYLSRKDLLNLFDAVRNVEREGVPGIFVEAGCALGGSSIAIGTAKHVTREFRVFDAFGMIPPPSDHDDADVHRRYEEIKSGRSKGLGNNTYYGYVDNLKEVVAANLARYQLPLAENRIQLIEGYFDDTLHVNEPVAFAHIDCDWYASVMTCLVQLEPNLSLGGVIVFDDYSDWSGCRTAVDEYFADKVGYQFTTQGRKLHVKKVLS